MGVQPSVHKYLVAYGLTVVMLYTNNWLNKNISLASMLACIVAKCIYDTQNKGSKHTYK